MGRIYGGVGPPFVAALVAGLLLLAGFSLYALTGDRYMGFYAPQIIEPAEWHVLEGDGELIPGGLAVHALGDRRIALIAVQMVNQLPAESVRMIEIKIDPNGAYVDLVFGWSRSRSLSEYSTHPVYIDDAGHAALDPVNFFAWEGDIEFLLLRTRGSLNPPLVIRELRILPRKPGFVEFYAGLLDEWVDWRPWSQASINQVIVGDGNPMVSPVLSIALWVVLSVIFILLWKVLTSGLVSLLSLALLIAAGWLLLDLRWQAELLYKLNDTRKQFAGKSWEEKQLSDIDGREFEFMQQLKEEIADTKQRVVIFSKSEFFHYRARYHALPQPAYSQNRLPNLRLMTHIRPGDYVVLLDEEVLHSRNITAPLTHSVTQKMPIHFKVENAVGRDAMLTEENAQYIVMLKDERGQLLRTAPYKISQPGFYRMNVRLSGQMDGSVARLLVHSLSLEGGRTLLAERRLRIGSEVRMNVSLPFALPEPGRVEFRVNGEQAPGLRLSRLLMEAVEEEDVVYLATGKGGPFLVTRPVLRSEAGVAFLVL